MSKISDIAKASKSKSFKELNPQFCGVSTHQKLSLVKLPHLDKSTPIPTVEYSTSSGTHIAFGIPPGYRDMVSPTERVLDRSTHVLSLSCEPCTDESKLNRTEKAYLTHLRQQGYDWIGIQNITIKLADDCRLTCDFVYLSQGQLTFIDVKGFQREDAFIKIKVAARLFPMFKFKIVKKNKDGWDVTDVKV